MLKVRQAEHQKMATERADDLQAFRSFIDKQLADGAAPTLGEALARWEFENATDEERVASVRAVREALDDMRAGDTGIPANEAIAALRRKHDLPEQS
jgi:hypothetical protein